MKKINFKKPKYIFPLIIFLPLVFLIYNIQSLFNPPPNNNQQGMDSLQTQIPAPKGSDLEDKSTTIEKEMSSNNEYYSALMGLDKPEETKTDSNLYTSQELDNIDAYKAQKEAEFQQKEFQQKESYQKNQHQNKYIAKDYYSSNNKYPSVNEQTDHYRELLSSIYPQYSSSVSTQSNPNNTHIPRGDDPEEEQEKSEFQQKELIQKIKSTKPKIEIVSKASNTNKHYFHQVAQTKRSYDILIKAIIDKSIKARSGTRLRFRLLDDVKIKNITIPKNTYIYGELTSFSGQRAFANITSILVNNQFVKIQLEVYDIDGMKGFYVPKSLYRELTNNIATNITNDASNFNINESSTSVSAESMALQAIKSAYQSVGNAITKNINSEKCTIKTNTVIYLINTSNNL